MLHVEGGDPPHRRIGPGDGEPDVDEGLEVDLVAAVAGRDERPEHAGGPEGLDHVVERAALRLGLGRRLGDQRDERLRPARRGLRRGWSPRAHGLTIPSVRRRAHPAIAHHRPHSRSRRPDGRVGIRSAPCRDCVRSPGPRWSHRWSCPCTTASSATATRSPSRARPPARPATGGRCSPTRPTCSSTPAAASRSTPARSARSARSSASWARPGPAGSSAASSCSPSTARRAAPRVLRGEDRGAQGVERVRPLLAEGAGAARLHRRARARVRPGRRRRCSTRSASTSTTSRSWSSPTSR